MNSPDTQKHHSPDNQDQRKAFFSKSRITLLLVMAAFILPVLVAKMVLDNHWYQEGSSNKGELIDPPQSFADLQMDNPHAGNWQILYLLPTHCKQACQDRLYLLKQSHTALGKYRNRVIPLVMLTPASDAKLVEQYQLPTLQANEAMQSVLANGELLVADPHGNLVMRYPAVNDKKAQIAQGKDLLADLRKMLKLSRIG